MRDLLGSLHYVHRGRTANRIRRAVYYWFASRIRHTRAGMVWMGARADRYRVVQDTTPTHSRWADTIGRACRSGRLLALVACVRIGTPHSADGDGRYSKPPLL